MLLLTICTGCRKNTKQARVVWPPESEKHNREASTLPADAELYCGYPSDDPLSVKGGVEVLGPDGQFWPVEDRPGTISGSFITQIGDIEKRAKCTGIAFIYKNVTKEAKTAWGWYLTEGELLLPFSFFEEEPPDNSYVENKYELEAFGKNHILIRIDPQKNHRVCIIDRNSYPTVNFSGSKAEINGAVIERRQDGWYQGDTNISRPN